MIEILSLLFESSVSIIGLIGNEHVGCMVGDDVLSSSLLAIVGILFINIASCTILVRRMDVGCFVGGCVGLCVGLIVGVCVGLRVGLIVGLYVGGAVILSGTRIHSPGPTITSIYCTVAWQWTMTAMERNKNPILHKVFSNPNV